MVSQRLHHLMVMVRVMVILCFISPIGDNGQKWAALSPIRFLKSLSRWPLMVRQGLHAGAVLPNSFCSVQLVTQGLQLNDTFLKLVGGATLRWLLAVHSPPPPSLTFAEELLSIVYR